MRLIVVGVSDRKICAGDLEEGRNALLRTGIDGDAQYLHAFIGIPVLILASTPAVCWQCVQVVYMNAITTTLPR